MLFIQYQFAVLSRRKASALLVGPGLGNTNIQANKREPRQIHFPHREI